jgi:nucleotide-binding universal stress UspA family protein
MYKKILIPLDGSKRAEAILPHVEELAHNFEAQVVFLQVIEPNYVYTSPPGYTIVNVEEISHEANTKQAESYLAGLAGEFREKNIKAKSIVENGSVSRTILNVAEREKVDLIAMASHGRSGLSRVFYGSVAASLLHSVDRPLLLVRAEGYG